MSDEQEKLTMKQRIDAFYRQSGGPNNPEITKILNKHLLYGKDHGVPGRRETIKDAFTEVFLSDRSTQPIVLGLMKMGQSIRNEWDRYLDAQRPDTEQLIEQLKRREQLKD